MRPERCAHQAGEAEEQGRTGQPSLGAVMLKDEDLKMKAYFLSFLKKLFIYLFWGALGLRCCAQAFSTYGKQGLLFVAEHGL